MNNSEKRIVNDDVAEQCPECSNLVWLKWDVAHDGYTIYCPYCGYHMKLCSMCDVRDGGKCDWSSETGANPCGEKDSRVQANGGGSGAFSKTAENGRRTGMKKHPNDEPVPLHTALWLDNHERIDATLKPCPFCGSKAFLCYTTDNKAMPYIKCGNFNSTGISTECYAQQQPWRYKTADEAAEAWNRRDM